MTQKDTGSAGYYSEYLGPVEDKPVAMSLRDYFAGQALANPRTFPQDWSAADEIADWAYGVADAMIEARKETNT